MRKCLLFREGGIVGMTKAAKAKRPAVIILVMLLYSAFLLSACGSTGKPNAGAANGETNRHTAEKVAEDAKLEKSGTASTGQRAVDEATETGTAATQESETDDSASTLYENEYFSLALPSPWTDNYKVTQPNARTFRFNTLNDEYVFQIYLLSEDEPFVEHAANYVICHLVGSEERYGVVYETPSDVRFTAETADNYMALSNSAGPDAVIAMLSPADGYTVEMPDYTEYLGTYESLYYNDTSDEPVSGYYVDINACDGSTITFSYTYVNQSVIDEFPEKRVSLNMGYGAFHGDDGHGFWCNGTIRLKDGVVIINNPESGYLYTNGDKILLPASSDSAEEDTDISAEASYTSAVVDENIDRFLMQSMAEVESAFGSDYTSNNGLEMDYPNIGVSFHADSSGKIWAILITGNHDLGGGARAHMKYPDIVAAFGESGGEPVDNGSVVQFAFHRDFTVYRYYWSVYDYENVESDGVLLTLAGEW